MNKKGVLIARSTMIIFLILVLALVLIFVLRSIMKNVF
jgi:hypothetical protein